MDCDHIFVYGTLRKTIRPDVHARYLGGRSEFVGLGTIEGELWRVTWYPAMTRGAGRVKGEVYRITDSGVWHGLDEFEACDLARPETSEYTREVVRVRLEDARDISAWSYFFLGDTRRLARISGGDFAECDPGERND